MAKEDQKSHVYTLEFTDLRYFQVLHFHGQVFQYLLFVCVCVCIISVRSTMHLALIFEGCDVYVH